MPAQPQQEQELSRGGGPDWSQLIELIGSGEVTATLSTPSGRRVVLMSELHYASLANRRSAPAAEQATRLTNRERDVLGAIEAGLSGSGAADELGLAVNTVAQHLASARRKLGVRSSNEAAALARRTGLLD